MRIVIGQKLTLRSRQWIVSRIGHYIETRIAEMDSVSMTAADASLGNVIYQAKHYDDFLDGDIITVKTERTTLTAVGGGDGLYIYSVYEVRKEHRDGSKRDDGTDSQAADAAPERSGDGDQDRQGDGNESADRTSGPVHGHGSGGEGGDPVFAGEGERC